MASKKLIIRHPVWFGVTLLTGAITMIIGSMPMSGFPNLHLFRAIINGTALVFASCGIVVIFLGITTDR